MTEPNEQFREQPPPLPPQDSAECKDPIAPESAGGTPALTAEEKQWGMFCHLSSLLGLVIGGATFVGPLICWLVKKDTSPFVDRHGKESLNFQLNILIYSLVGVVIAIATCGIGAILFIPLLAYAIVMAVMAGLKANAGEEYRYPYTFRLIK